MFRLSVTKCHRVASGSEATVRVICATKSSSVRVGPREGPTIVPCATSKLAIKVTVPRRIYPNSRRSTRPGPIGMVGCLRSRAWMPVHLVGGQDPFTRGEQCLCLQVEGSHIGHF